MQILTKNGKPQSYSWEPRRRRVNPTDKAGNVEEEEVEEEFNKYLLSVAVFAAKHNTSTGEKDMHRKGEQNISLNISTSKDRMYAQKTVV